MEEQKNNEKMQFLEDFLSGQEADHKIAETNLNDKIEKLTSSVEKTKESQSKDKKIIDACNAFVANRSTSAFESIAAYYIAEYTKKQSKKKSQKIKRLKNKIRKVKRSLKKNQRKQQKTSLLKGVINIIKAPDTGQSEYITAMQAMKEDSLFRAENQLEKTKAKIAKAVLELNKDNISETKRVKIESRIRKLISRRDKLIDKITGLNELTSELSKLSKMELADDKIDELKNTSVETAEKSVMNGSAITDIIDDQTEAAKETIQDIIEPESKKEEKTKDIQSPELTGQVDEKTESVNMTIRSFKPDEAAKLMSAGIEFSIVRSKDGNFSAIVKKTDTQKIVKALSERTEQQEHHQAVKR